MIEKIIHNETMIALIIFKNYKQDGIQFFSPDEYPLQLGYMSRPKGYKIKAHIHKSVHRQTTGTQEVLFIKTGVIRVNFYHTDQKYLKSRVLNKGDIILLANAGHSFEILEDAEIVEVKNGPFVEGQDKVHF